MPNVEMKSRYDDLGRARAIALELGGTFLWKDTQVDTYFVTSKGKLKLRESGLSGAELLPYIKIENGGLKRSDYAKIPITDPKLVKDLFNEILGSRLEIHKMREVYLIENIRVHLDIVDHLGTFLEFEAVFDQDSPEVVVQEQKKVKSLIEKFGVNPKHLLNESYPELLARSCEFLSSVIWE